ncbi:MAG TPA: hypothetical protein PK413_06175, partial [Thermoanaerobaculia bacterium]|nr:hypothetical protein [Thermoanaerobaculia bacterium]
EWVAEGGGQPGTGAGSFSFQLEAGGAVLTRHNVADYPAAEGRPASHHEDLMVLYQEAPDGALKAIYFDSEGHVLHYAVDVSAGQGDVRLVSESVPGAPRFELRYRKAGEAGLSGEFNIAPPGKAEFGPYLRWTARRTASR